MKALALPCRPRARLAAVLLAVAAAPAGAATFVWPNLSGFGACTSTLQNCIDQALNGDVVEIGNDDFTLPGVPPDGYTTIDESVVITNGLTLRSRPGVDGVFAPGRGVTVVSPLAGGIDVTLERLVFRGGQVEFRHRSAVASRYAASQLRFVAPDPANPNGCVLGFVDDGGGTPTFIAGDNTITLDAPSPPLSPSGICMTGVGGPWQVNVFRNRIASTHHGIHRAISVAGTSSGTVDITGNQVTGHDFVSGISVSQNAGSSGNVLQVVSNLVIGQRIVPSSATEYGISIGMTNTDARIVNNTIVHGTKGLLLFGPTAGNTGRVANNLVAYHEVSGLSISTLLTGVTNGNNLVFSNVFDLFTPGPGTLTSDPQLRDAVDPRLRPFSPAINTGNVADVPTVLGLAFDADGERRILSPSVDVGAFEYSSDLATVHRASADNITLNRTLIEGLDTLGPLEHMIVTPHDSAASPTEMARTIGVYHDAAATPTPWYVFHEEFSTAMSPGRRFSVFAPLSSVTSYTHTSTAGNSTAEFTQLDDPELNSRPFALAFVMHNWNPGSAPGIYHDHRLGIDYFGNRWYIRNQDLADMAFDRGFNVVIAPLGSPNAFQVQLGASAAAELRLDHRLLDDNACAAPVVTRVDVPNDAFTVVNDTAFSVQYRHGFAGAPGHWFVVAEGTGTPTFPGRSGFNVFVPGFQANTCRDDRIFADGFD